MILGENMRRSPNERKYVEIHTDITGCYGNGGHVGKKKNQYIVRVDSTVDVPVEDCQGTGLAWAFQETLDASTLCKTKNKYKQTKKQTNKEKRKQRTF